MGGKVHGLLFVEIRVVKRRQADQPVAGFWRKVFGLNVQPVGTNDGQWQLLKVLGGQSVDWLWLPGRVEVGGYQGGICV